MRMMIGHVAPTSGGETVGGRRCRDVPHPTGVVGAGFDAASFRPRHSALDTCASTPPWADTPAPAGPGLAARARRREAHRPDLQSCAHEMREIADDVQAGVGGHLGRAVDRPVVDPHAARGCGRHGQGPGVGTPLTERSAGLGGRPRRCVRCGARSRHGAGCCAGRRCRAARRARRGRRQEAPVRRRRETGAAR